MLKPEKRDVPRPDEGEILIRVRAAGVNRPDVQQRKGLYPPPPGASDLPGLEVAGEVAAVGAGVKRWRVGDQVCALTPGGGYAEYVTVHETNALPMPPGFTFTEAAALPENLLHRLAQCVPARRPEERRDAARAWRLVGHRHHRDPACHRLRRLCDHHGRFGGKMRRLPRSSAPTVR